MRFKELLNEENFNSIKKEFEKNNIPFEKNNVKLQAYRVGSVEGNNPRGFFFADSKESVKHYVSLHDDSEIKKYNIFLKKVLVAGHQNSVTQLFFNKSYGDMMDKFVMKAGSGTGGARAFDKKIKNFAIKNGFKGIIYTNPAPPAKMEIVVFSNKDFKEAKK